MATCNDCVHHDICSLWSTTDLIQDEAQKYCNGNFKNKADVVEVVRCKNCGYANDDGTICRYGVGRDTKPDHYCSYGERRITDG